jgi:hypothetical protein
MRKTNAHLLDIHPDLTYITLTHTASTPNSQIEKTSAAIPAPIPILP